VNEGNASFEDMGQIHWTENLEAYFASTGEKAHCLAWVHKKSEQLYSTRRTFIDLPVIVGSGIIAFLNAGSSSMFPDPQISSVALGIGSLVVGILNTMGTYFGWAKRAEGHRLSAIHYAKLFRFISVELSLPREERMGPHDFLRYVKDQYDRLAETSPLVPPVILHKFTRRFMKKYPDVAKPEETNGLEKIRIYKPAPTDVIRGSSTVDPLSPKPLGPTSSFASDLGSIGSPKDTSSFMNINPMRLAKATIGATIGAAVGAPAESKNAEDFPPSAKALQDIAASGIGIPKLPLGLVNSAVAPVADASPQEPATSA
jgi:hypothetical protein